MPQIIIENLFHKKINFENTTESVLKILQENFIDWMHACGGKGRCTTCKMIITENKEGLTEPSDFEQKCRRAGLLNESERLACQCQPLESIKVKVPSECKLPHMEYSD